MNYDTTKLIKIRGLGLTTPKTPLTFPTLREVWGNPPVRNNSKPPLYDNHPPFFFGWVSTEVLT